MKRNNLLKVLVFLMTNCISLQFYSHSYGQKVNYFQDFDLLKFSPIAEISDTIVDIPFVKVYYQNEKVDSLAILCKGKLIDSKKFYYFRETPYEATPIGGVIILYSFYFPDSIWCIEVSFRPQKGRSRQHPLKGFFYPELLFNKKLLSAYPGNVWLHTENSTHMFWQSPQHIECIDSLIPISKSYLTDNVRILRTKVIMQNPDIVFLDVEEKLFDSSRPRENHLSFKPHNIHCLRRLLPYMRYLEVISYFHPGYVLCARK